VDPSLEALHGIRLTDWIARYKFISRTTAYELLRILQIEPEPRRVQGSRKPVSHLLPEHLERLEPVAQQLEDGATLSQIREQLGQSSGIVPARPKHSGKVSDGPESSQLVPTRPEQSGQLQVFEALAEAMNRNSPPPDPLAVPRALATAADEGLPLTSAELGQLLNRSAEELEAGRGSLVLRGFRLERRGRKDGRAWYVSRAWQRQDSDNPGAPLVANTGKGASGRQVGFGAVLDVEWRAVDTTGSRIFAQNRLFP
jgi:hypothetical protein